MQKFKSILYLMTNIQTGQSTNIQTGRSILNAFADERIDVAQMLEFVFERKENIIEKEELADEQHVLLLPLMVSK